MRVAYALVGILLLALVASLLTEATLAVGHHGRIADDSLIHVSPSATPRPSPSLMPSPSIAPTATPVPTAPPVVPTAVTNSFVHLRAGASTATPIVTDLNGGTTVVLGPYRDSQWQQVTYNGLNGYIFRSYLNY